MTDRLDRIEAALERLTTTTAAAEQRLSGSVESLAHSMERLAQNMTAGFATTAKLVEDTSASLQREMAAGFADVARIEAATARNTRMLAGGSKTVAAHTQWMARQDATNRKQAQELRDLRARLAKLERAGKRKAS